MLEIRRSGAINMKISEQYTCEILCDILVEREKYGGNQWGESDGGSFG